MKLDLPLLQKRKINLISPLLIVNYETVRNLTATEPNQMVTGGTDTVLSYTK